MRRLATGMPSLLLATLVLFARLVAPVMAMPAADDAGLFGPPIICHADAPAAPGKPAHPARADCLLCPACHLVAYAALPTPAVPVPPPPALAAGIGAPLPPATGPPLRARTAAQPTGPPALSF